MAALMSLPPGTSWVGSHLLLFHESVNGVGVLTRRRDRGLEEAARGERAQPGLVGARVVADGGEASGCRPWAGGPRRRAPRRSRRGRSGWSSRWRRPSSRSRSCRRCCSATSRAWGWRGSSATSGCPGSGAGRRRVAGDHAGRVGARSHERHGRRVERADLHGVDTGRDRRRGVGRDLRAGRGVARGEQRARGAEELDHDVIGGHGCGRRRHDLAGGAVLDLERVRGAARGGGDRALELEGVASSDRPCSGGPGPCR